MVALKLNGAVFRGSAARELLLELGRYLAHIYVRRIEAFDDCHFLAVPTFLDTYVYALRLLRNVLTDTEVVRESTGRTDLRHAESPSRGRVFLSLLSNGRGKRLGFTCRLHQHDYVSFSYRTDSVPGEYTTLVGALKDTCFYLHSFSVHTCLPYYFDYLCRRRPVTFISVFFRF